MANRHSDPIRNLALLGHAGSGKSTLVEALLQRAGNKPLQVGQGRGTPITDFTRQEQEAGHSLETALFHLNHHQTRINLIDTPGNPDFFGRAMSILPAVETAGLVVNARQGVELVTRKAFELMQQRDKCGLIIINHCDASEAKAEQTLLELQRLFGGCCLPINLPSKDGSRVVDCYFSPEYNAEVAFSSVTQAHDTLVEQVIEMDEGLMELYLEQEQSIEPAQLHDPFEQCLRESHLLPVCFVSAKTGAGLDLLLDIIAELMPTPWEGNPPLFMKKNMKKTVGEEAVGESVEVVSDPDRHAIAHVFKVVTDPFVGRMGVFRIHQGTIHNGSQLFVGEDRKAFRVNHLLKLQGAEHIEVDSAGPGEICAVAKVDSIHFDAVLHDSHDEDHFYLKPLGFPPSMSSLAITPVRHGDEQKLSDILHKVLIEDPSIRLEHNEQYNETIISGLGDGHLQAVLARMKENHDLEVRTSEPGIPYRETIQKPAEGHHRHKKQSGGAGQFGEVFLRIEPLERGAGFEFSSEVVGGAIPGPFIPAVEKGVLEVMHSGAIAGSPMQDIRVVVYDGKHHSVDSREIAFVTAGRKAFLDAVSQASPVILEPYVSLEVRAPDWSVGDITGHLASDRGMVTGTEALDNGYVCVRAEIPLASMSGYSNLLKSITSGEGEFVMELSHYEAVPADIQKALIRSNQTLH